MPEYRHPLAGDGPGYPPARVHISRAENAEVSDGTFEAPEAVGEAVAARFDMAESDLRVTDGPETCDAVKSDGEVCGRERPCPYHGEEGGDE